ncbi:MAG: helix-turn-helix domain-containing protein [Lachnospiraceae bacterium]|nr:helix-turn-helix domain-containing protein [Lachnospiraceae bacterium]MCD8398969.1 helix-turn-helix domain-containing protein [Lachnospiraceae bacterium]
MAHKIKSIKAKENLMIEATFFDGSIKEYNIANLFSAYPQLKILENNPLFYAVQIDVGGYGISWSDDLDLDAETIWEEGFQIGKDCPDPILEVAFELTVEREKAGLTQKQLAERAGMYQAEISKIERGLSNPSILTLQRLAECMGLTLQIRFQKEEMG